MSTEPITDRRLAILRRRFESMSNVYVGADGCELLDEIDRLRAEREEIADLLERATKSIDPHFGHTPEDVNGHPHSRICQECTANLCDEGGEENWTDEQVEYWRSMDPLVIELRKTAARMRTGVA